MTYIQNILNENLLKLSASLKLIKRKQKYFNKFNLTVHEKVMQINPATIIEYLNKSCEKLANFNPEHVILINEASELDKIFKMFCATTNFNLQKYEIGMFSNVNLDSFVNAVAMISFHDRRDRKAIIAAKQIGIARFGFNNLSRGFFHFSDFTPINNFCKKTITLVTWYIGAYLKVKLKKEFIPFEEYYKIVHGTEI